MGSSDRELENHDVRISTLEKGLIDLTVIVTRAMESMTRWRTIGILLVGIVIGLVPHIALLVLNSAQPALALAGQ